MTMTGEMTVQQEPLPVLPPPRDRWRYRYAMGYSRAHVAGLLGVSPRTVERWEHGATPRPETRRAYARLLTQWQHAVTAAAARRGEEEIPL